jgi:hypothetical protein
MRALLIVRGVVMPPRQRCFVRRPDKRLPEERGRFCETLAYRQTMEQVEGDGGALHVAIDVIHTTAGELLQPMDIWTLTIMLVGPRAACNTASCRSTPAISRSELVRCPLGFVIGTTASITYVGHWTRHTIGCRCFPAPNHTPPAPKALASQ